MPSRTHDLLARVVPRVRRSRELDSEPAERARVERWHTTLDRSFPTALVPRFSRRFSLLTEELAGFPVQVMTPRHVEPTRTVLHLHGGGYMAPTDPFHVRFLARLAEDLRARVVVPDYPLAPEHTWRDSFEPLVGLVSRWADPGPGGGSRCPATPPAVATRWRSPKRSATGAVRSRPSCCCSRRGATCRPRPPRPRRTTPWTRGCSSARSAPTRSGGPAPRPT